MLDGVYLSEEKEKRWKETGAWLFAYGSLIWDMPVPFLEKCFATATSYRRELCVISTRLRGTPEKPGLVYGLLFGGTCAGVIYRFPPDQQSAALATIRARELASDVYREEIIEISLPTARSHCALAYVVRPAHPKVLLGLNAEQISTLVGQASGAAGTNADYVSSTQLALSLSQIDDSSKYTEG